MNKEVLNIEKEKRIEFGIRFTHPEATSFSGENKPCDRWSLKE